MATTEFNFDGLVGPTHNYAGLSHGNVASTGNRNVSSSPRTAALQGLEKMKFVRDLGVEQAILPPLQRPNLNFLRDSGFTGTDTEIIEKAHAVDPVLVAICFSASSMWTANAATVSPTADTADGKLHLTPANLGSNLHRSLEAAPTTAMLRQIFADENLFTVHDALQSTAALFDEGAANHTRLCSDFGQAGLELFVYGHQHLNRQSPRPVKFPARQTMEASSTLARRHGLATNGTKLIQQNPAAIDAGVFHNDVISVGHQNVLLCHELAFIDQNKCIEEIRHQFESVCDSQLHVISFAGDELTVDEAIGSYLFNSQIVTKADGSMTLICPIECEQNNNAYNCTQKIIAEPNPISDVRFLDLRQSMNNGGGPACLRLRVVLTDEQAANIHQGVRLTDKLYDQLTAWVQQHYRDSLSPDDLRDPNLLMETSAAFESLAKIIQLPVDQL